MPVVNKNGLPIGKRYIYGQLINFYWKNILTARGKAKRPKRRKTIPQSRATQIVSQLATRWSHVLTPAQRSSWEAYAIGEQTMSESQQVPKTHPGFRKPPKNGFNAYVRGNVGRFAMREVVPSEFAPSGQPYPVTAFIGWANEEKTKLMIAWITTAYPTGFAPVKEVFRIWLWGKTPVQLIAIANNPNTSAPSRIYTLEIETVRHGGRLIGVGDYYAGGDPQIVTASWSVMIDVVALMRPGEAAAFSHPSNIDSTDKSYRIDEDTDEIIANMVGSLVFLLGPQTAYFMLRYKLTGTGFAQVGKTIELTGAARVRALKIIDDQALLRIKYASQFEQGATHYYGF